MHIFHILCISFKRYFHILIVHILCISKTYRSYWSAEIVHIFNESATYAYLPKKSSLFIRFTNDFKLGPMFYAMMCIMRPTFVVISFTAFQIETTVNTNRSTHKHIRNANTTSQRDLQMQICKSTSKVVILFVECRAGTFVQSNSE